MFYLPEKLAQTIVSGLGLQMIEEFRAGEVREGTCTAQCTGIPQTPKLVLAHPKNDHACSRFSDHGCLLERWVSTSETQLPGIRHIRLSSSSRDGSKAHVM